MESKELVALCRQNAIDVKSQLSTIEPEVRDQIVQLVQQQGSGSASSSHRSTSPLPPVDRKIPVLETKPRPGPELGRAQHKPALPVETTDKSTVPSVPPSSTGTPVPSVATPSAPIPKIAEPAPPTTPSRPPEKATPPAAATRPVEPTPHRRTEHTPPPPPGRSHTSSRNCADAAGDAPLALGTDHHGDACPRSGRSPSRPRTTAAPGSPRRPASHHACRSAAAEAAIHRVPREKTADADRSQETRRDSDGVAQSRRWSREDRGHSPRLAAADARKTRRCR